MILNAESEYRVCILVSLLNHDNFLTEYLKEINFITGGPLGAEGPEQLPPLPLLNPALMSTLGVAPPRLNCLQRP